MLKCLFLSIVCQGSLGGRNIQVCIADICWEVQEISHRGRTAEPVNSNSICKDLMPPQILPHVVSACSCGACNERVGFAAGRYFSCSCYTAGPAAQLPVKKQIWHKIVAKVIGSGTAAATEKTQLCRALCLQEPPREHSNNTHPCNPAHPLIWVEIEQHGQRLQKGHHRNQTLKFWAKLRSVWCNNISKYIPWPAKSSPSREVVEQLLSPLNWPEGDWELVSTSYTE